MKRAQSAVARTVSMFRGTTYGEEQQNAAPPIVDEGEAVLRVAFYTVSPSSGFRSPSTHYRRPREMVTLCGLPFGDSSDAADLGVCLGCRAEASRLRARVTR